MVEIVTQDHAQLRLLVYEFARRNLRRSLHQQFEDGDWDGLQERMQELETAIADVESEYAQKNAAPTFVSEPPLTYWDLTNQNLSPTRSSTEIETLDPIGRPFASFGATPERVGASPLHALSEGDVFFAVARFGKAARSRFWWKAQLVLAVLVGVMIYAAVDGRSALRFAGLRAPGNIMTENQARAGRSPADDAASSNAESSDATSPDATSPGVAATRAVRPHAPAMPMPAEYGAFALSNGRLIELGSIAMRIPDQRVAISPVISTPSRTHVAADKLEFVVFRRDLATNAPDHTTVRVIAQILRALTFDAAGKATTTTVNDAWVVRGNAYPMRVAPVPDNPEMIVIKPEAPDFVFPAGRYALVLKTTAYDFTVDGPVSDNAHCLERTDALTAPIYTECRAP
jgi:hypothetical protein